MEYYKTGLDARLGAVANCTDGGVDGAGFADPNPVLVAPLAGAPNALVPGVVAPKPELLPKPPAAGVVAPKPELLPKPPAAGVGEPNPPVEPKPAGEDEPNAEAPPPNPAVDVVAPPNPDPPKPPAPGAWLLLFTLTEP